MQSGTQQQSIVHSITVYCLFLQQSIVCCVVNYRILMCVLFRCNSFYIAGLHYILALNLNFCHFASSAFICRCKFVELIYEMEQEKDENPLSTPTTMSTSSSSSPSSVSVSVPSFSSSSSSHSRTLSLSSMNTVGIPSPLHGVQNAGRGRPQKKSRANVARANDYSTVYKGKCFINKCFHQFHSLLHRSFQDSSTSSFAI